MEDLLHSPAWYGAVLLAERIDPSHTTEIDPERAAASDARAARRLQRWRSLPAFASQSLFTQRLAADGLTEDQLYALLHEPLDSLQRRLAVPPAWLTTLIAAFAPASSADIDDKQDHVEMLSPVQPIIAQGRARVRAGAQRLAQSYPHAPFDPQAVEAILFQDIPDVLALLVSRTLVLEMHVAGMQGQLQGSTPEERYQSFIQRLRQPKHALALLQEYPVLARQVTTRIDQWASFSLELLQHLCADWSAIREMFSSASDPGRLVAVEGRVGDRHRNGRSVQILRFASGFRLVYKPKSLAVDRHFQELIGWLNQRGAQPALRAALVLDRDHYGWVEHIAAQPCHTADEIQRFYERQGAYLAVLYALEATDFHSENLIAAGEHPIPIDLEALFHPHEEIAGLAQADQLAAATMNQSVLRVGLLPLRTWARADSAGLDLSGLGSIEGQLTPQEIPYWENKGTDAMRLGRKRVAMPERQNRPSLAGTPVDALAYTPAIVDGFTRMYRLLHQQHAALLATGGPLARFVDDEVRVVVRPTQTYAWLLQESYHPDVLRDALDRERFFDALWSGVEQRPALARVIAAERRDLLCDDLPLFTTRPGSRSIWSSRGEQIQAYLDETGMSLVRRRLQRMDEDDLKQQSWFIRASLATLAGTGQHRQHSVAHPVAPHGSASKARLLAAARDIGDRLEALAISDGIAATWIGLTLTPHDTWVLAPLGLDLYDGVPGVVLFLAQLGALTGEARYTTLARRGLATMRHGIRELQSHVASVGAFDGWGGLIYTLTRLSLLWEEPPLLDEATALVERLPALIAQDTCLDLISGVAGCLTSLLALYQHAPAPHTFSAAVACGERLLVCAETVEHGIGWPTHIAATGPLLGFSHGVSGMAWSLLRLAELTGEQRFHTAAQAAIDYERSLFDLGKQNWPDLRDMTVYGSLTGDSHDMTAWCHGAPGIGMARLAGLPYLDNAAVRADLDAALQRTLSNGFGFNHSLCHGDLGNLDLLLQAQTSAGYGWLSQPIEQIAAMLLASIEAGGWRCGGHHGIETPGLMTGLAGIGYGLLRVAEPLRVPSVLVLEHREVPSAGLLPA